MERGHAPVEDWDKPQETLWEAVLAQAEVQVEAAVLHKVKSAVDKFFWSCLCTQ